MTRLDYIREIREVFPWYKLKAMSDIQVFTLWCKTNAMSNEDIRKRYIKFIEGCTSDTIDLYNEVAELLVYLDI